MRMARVNITIPDDLLRRARTEGLNVSALASAALAEELDRRRKIVALDIYLAELEAEHGPIPEVEQAEAQAWVERVLPPVSRPRSARSA